MHASVASLFLPTVPTKQPRHQNCRFPYLYFRFANWSNIIRMLPLQIPHEARYEELRRDGYQHVDVIGARPRTEYLDSLALAFLTQDLSYGRLQLSLYHLPSVFRCKHYMIFAFPFRMGQALLIYFFSLFFCGATFGCYTWIIRSFLFLSIAGSFPEVFTMQRCLLYKINDPRNLFQGSSFFILAL